MSRVGIRVQDLFDEKILRQKIEGALEQKNHLLVKVYNRRAITVDEVVDEFLVLRRAAAADGRRHRAGAGAGARRAARPSCSKAARRPSSTSTTAPIRSSRRRTRRPAAPAPARVSRRRASTGSSRLSRPTPPGSAPAPSRPSCSVPTMPLREAARRRRRVRHDHGPPAAVRLVRRSGSPLRRPGQRGHRLRAHQARRAHRLGEGPGLRRLRRRRGKARRDADDPDRLPPRHARVRAARWLGRGHLDRPIGGRPAQDGPAVRRALWKRCPGRRSPRSVSARDGTRPCRSAHCWADPSQRRRTSLPRGAETACRRGGVGRPPPGSTCG